MRLNDRNKEEVKKGNRYNRGTASALVIHQKRKQCILYLCGVISDVNLRRQKLKDDNQCFRCLRQGHNSRTCRLKIYCFTCKAQNSHDLCTTDRNESSTTVVVSKDLESGDSNINVAGLDESVLLQTANGYVADIKEERITKAKILLY